MSFDEFIRNIGFERNKYEICVNFKFLTEG